VDPDESDRRAWGSGAIYPVKDGWRVALSLGRDAQGKRIRKEWQFRQEAPARAKLADLERRLDRGLPLEERRVTVAVYVDEWLVAVKPSVRSTTFAFYSTLARLHLDDIRHLPLRALDTGDLRRLIAKRLDEGYAPRTVRGIVDVVRMMLRQAVGDGLVDRNVAELVQLPKLEQKEPSHFTTDQAWTFLDAIADDPLHSLFVTAFGTGLRRSELLALTWRDVDLERGVLLVRQSKTKSGIRSIPLASFVVDALRSIDRKPGPVWPVTATYVSHRMPALSERAGLPRLRFHEIRHSTASMLADAGVDWELIREILGHSRMRQTAHYARSDIEVKRAALEKIGRKAVG
jgi:integrase